MKKSIFNIISLLSIFTVLNSQIQVELQYDLWGLESEIEITGQNLSYILNGFTYVDLWTKTVQRLIPSAVCTNNSELVQTTNSSVFCLQAGEQNFLNMIDPSTATIIKQFPYNGQNLGSLMGYDDYIVFTNSDNTTISADIFDATTSEFYCHIPPFTTTDQIMDISTNGQFIVVVLGNRPNGTILYISCNEATVIQTFFPNVPGRMLTLNETSVFVLSAYDVNTFEELYVPFYFDLTGQARFGNGMPNGFFYYPYSDSQVLFPINTGLEKTVMGNYYVDSSLSLKLSQTYQIDINQFEAEVSSFIEGDNSLLFGANQVTFLYNLSTDEITYAWNSLPPITLANGTVLNLTGAAGYTIQLPGEPIQFKDSAFGYLYQGLDYDNYWVFYNPKYSKQQGYDQCTLTRIQISTSTITEYTLKTCSCYTASGAPPLFLVFDVDLNENGIPTITYICSDSYYTAFIANTTNEILSLPVAKGGIPILSTNLEQQSMSVVYTLNNHSVILEQFNITTKKLINTTSIPSSNSVIATTLIDGSFIIGYSYSSFVEFVVFDVNTWSVASRFNSSLSFDTFYIAEPNFFAVGVDPQNPTGFAAILISPTGQNTYLIEQSGITTKVPVDPSVGEYYSVIPATNNSFFIANTITELSHVLYYEITSW